MSKIKLEFYNIKIKFLHQCKIKASFQIYIKKYKKFKIKTNGLKLF
jgi:hypothetical protein